MQTHFSKLMQLGSYMGFAQFQAMQDGAKAGFYPGVLVIEKGPAKGHYAVKLDGGRVVNYDYDNPDHAELKRYPVTIDDCTLDDVVKCGNDSESAKCKLDHGSTVTSIVGHYATFRREGDKVRADLTLLESSPSRAYVEEIITKMAKKIGNSIDFDYIYEIQGDKAIARCVKLNSVDIVDTPAATNSLFEHKPENTQTKLTMTPEELTAIRGAFKEETDKLETKFNARFDALKTQLEEGGEKKEDDEEDDDKKKVEDSDKDGMSATIEKAVFKAMKSAMPKAALTALHTQEQNPNKGDDTYEAKHAAAVTAGMSIGQATAFMARKHPTLYNAKFGAPQGQRATA